MGSALYIVELSEADVDLGRLNRTCKGGCSLEYLPVLAFKCKDK